MKSVIKLFASVSCATLLVVGLSPAARADAWNKKTILTVNQAIQVPNKVLEPGQYVFKLADSQSDRHIVQIFNGDESHIITTILAIPNYRLQPTGKSQFTFWETPAGEPRALRAWFYPGDNFGQEFPYRPAQFARITSTRAPVVTYSQSTQESAKVEETPKVEEKVEERTEIAQNTPPPAPAPAPPAAEPPPARVQADQPPAELPHTASNTPLIALAGLLSLGGFVITGVRSRRTP